MRWFISFLFVFQVYLAMAVISVIFFPYALLSRNGARAACKTYSWWALTTARLMCGIRYEVRGSIPSGEVLIAAKHQSFLDVIMIFYSLPACKFIMKQELLYTPFIGQYGYRIGCIPVRRGRRTEAIKRMVNDVNSGTATPGQLCIYPQGTRILPGERAPYKVGTYALYRETGQSCVPVAVNAGVFWPRKGIERTPGLAVIEFLDPIPPGLGQSEFMERLETVVEARSEELLVEARAQL